MTWDRSDQPFHRPPGPYPWEERVIAAQRPRLTLTHIVLFVTTALTTTVAGALQAGADLVQDPWSIQAGIPFAATLLSILLIHELGHYTLARWHRVAATLPYFIPAPPLLIGTFGAFIRMQTPPPNRRALFDVGAAGPWAGLLIAVPAAFVGLRLSEVRPLALGEGGLVLGDSILFSWLTRLALGTTADDVTIILHPVALAGWFGLFVTFLNLLPVGQLDGGHVAYALFGRWHRWIARSFLALILVLGMTGWQGWLMWVILLLLIGLDHPPTRDLLTPLDVRRQVAGWLTVGVLIVTFMANPLSVAQPPPEFEGERTPVHWTRERPVAPRVRLVVPWGAPRRAREIVT